MVRQLLVGLVSVSLASATWAAFGVADIKGTAPNSPIKGTVTLEDTPKGLEVRAQIANLPPGVHGFHIHEFGSCADAAKAAGGHYNPMGASHGDVLKAGLRHAHAGDMGNITAGPDGTANVNVTIPGVSLSAGSYTVAGRSIVVHEKNDDLTSQPAGNAGGRIGCGPILVAASSSK